MGSGDLHQLIKDDPNAIAYATVEVKFGSLMLH